MTSVRYGIEKLRRGRDGKEYMIELDENELTNAREKNPFEIMLTQAIYPFDC